ncbi:hypothetical protein V500_10697 [Pseudogymnoascus sp. VKM F-4518 (FW-2643)]|nr:hypothetical protein V500_10697 [Pseudogymnoascus sp. VKM F-4518 (FW-2643)]
MEPSPLTQQSRPEVFQQKIVELYDGLFKDDEGGDKSEGFWTEFFLLKPDLATLRRILGGLSPSDLLNLQNQTRSLFPRAIKCIKAGSAPADTHALDTLTVLLASVLSKKYNNPSSDIINVLAGLDQVDSVFTEFVAVLDNTIRTGRSLDIRQKAIEFIQDTDSTTRTFEPFTLLGLLANYNKFEFQNPYRLRLEDFVNKAAIQKIITSTGATCSRLRTKYVAVQNDLPEGWSLASAFGMLGLGGLIGAKPAAPVIDPEAAKKMFAELPGAEAAVLLATYDFVHANKLFCFNLVTLEVENKQAEPPIASFISLTSYLLEHAYISARTSLYARLNLLTIRLLVEDPALCKRICSPESKTPIRLCRQRSPYLPLIRGDRILATALLDAMIDGINHNLRRRLDVDLYALFLDILQRLIGHLARTRTRLPYHWSELFRSLLTLIRFMATYAADLAGLPRIEALQDALVNLIALALSAGEAFLPTPAAYDDLFYKLVETGDVLVKFSEAYGLAKRPGCSIGTLVSVSAHYKELLKDGVRGSGVRNLTSAQVAQVIKQGYETLSIQTREGLDGWEKYREADERVFLKKVARAAVADAKMLVDAP